MEKYTKSLDNLIKHPITRIIGIITIITTTITAVALFISSHYYSNQINELNAIISRLSPVAGKSSSINFSDFFIFRNDSLSESTLNHSVFNCENLFYHSNSDYWNYELMSPIQFINFINGRKSTLEESLDSNNQSHVWYSPFKIELNNPEYTNLLINEKSAYVIDSSDKGMIIRYQKKPKNIIQYIKLKRYNNDLSFIARRNLSNLFETEDSASFRSLGFKYLSSSFIDQIFSDLFSEFPNSIAFTEINNISMQKNWLFLSSLSVFGGKNISNGKKNTVYCFNEWYILYSDLNTYVLEIQTPSFEPIRRGEQFKELNSWLSYFKVVMKF